VFSKIKGIFGGRCQIMITGSAPIKPSVLDFLKIAIGVNIREGYGMTESTAS